MSMPLLQMEEKDSMISSLHEELKSLIMNSVMSAAVLADEAAGSKSDPTPCADDETEVTDSQSTPQEMLDVPYYDSPRRSSKSPKGGSRTSSPRKSGSRSPSKSSSPNLSTSKSTPSPGLQSPTKKSSSLVHSPKKSKVKCCPNPKCENPNALTTVEEFNHSGGSPSDSMNNLLHNVDYSKTCSRLIMQAKSLQMPNHPSITDSLALDDFPYNPDCNCDFTQNVSAFQGIDRAEKDESSSPRRSSPTKQSPSNLSSPSNEAGSPRRSTSKSPTKLSTRGDSSAKMSSADSPARTSKQTCCDNPNCENPTATRIPSTDLENVKSMIKACSRSKSMMIQSQMSDLEGVVFNMECKCDYTPVSSPIGNEAQSPRRSTSKSPTKLSTGGDSSSVKMSSADSPARTSKQTCCKHPKCENPEADLVV
ncbi:PREDICTED: probable serine/threonine-protein kinase dyrk2 [Nicrophorus vespilloides]|uniref:Probable serine/threonine-protein kinase dyrk2 n=1 Tax=Nicrophorus vespilloides TaxID=110193 RepID=A0ABM1MNR1_NICVS|nr:PREDICTED: probable serine/threonine-protein kinase dyrk2 [Nicrophorus vespilloides]